MLICRCSQLQNLSNLFAYFYYNLKLKCIAFNFSMCELKAEGRGPLWPSHYDPCHNDPATLVQVTLTLCHYDPSSLWPKSIWPKPLWPFVIMTQTTLTHKKVPLWPMPLWPIKYFTFFKKWLFLIFHPIFVFFALNDLKF